MIAPRRLIWIDAKAAAPVFFKALPDSGSRRHHHKYNADPNSVECIVQ